MACEGVLWKRRGPWRAILQSKIKSYIAMTHMHIITVIGCYKNDVNKGRIFYVMTHPFCSHLKDVFHVDLPTVNVDNCMFLTIFGAFDFDFQL